MKVNRTSVQIEINIWQKYSYLFNNCEKRNREIRRTDGSGNSSVEVKIDVI